MHDWGIFFAFTHDWAAMDAEWQRIKAAGMRFPAISQRWLLTGPSSLLGAVGVLSGRRIEFLANPLIWVRESGSGGHVVLKAMGDIMAAIV